MPNHIQNRLKVVGKKGEVARLLNHIKGSASDGSDLPIDFNKIIQCPKDLNITCGSLGSMAQNLLFGTGDDYLGISAAQKRMRGFNSSLRREAVDLALKYQENLETHGVATWYDWNNKYWGTKWNAYAQPDKRNTDDTIYFQTAWASPVRLIKELSNQFPEVDIHLDFASEDSGCNTGKLKIHAGDVLAGHYPENSSNEAYELFLELHPDCDYIKMVNGKYEHVEE